MEGVRVQVEEEDDEGRGGGEITNECLKHHFLALCSSFFMFLYHFFCCFSFSFHFLLSFLHSLIQVA